MGMIRHDDDDDDDFSFPWKYAYQPKFFDQGKPVVICHWLSSDVVGEILNTETII